MIEYLRTVSGESPFLLREPDEVNFTVEKERAILQNKAESPNEIKLTAYVNGELAGNCSLASQGDKRRTKHRCCVSIALYEKYCNLGLGRILLSTVLGLAKQCGYTQAELGVIDGNVQSMFTKASDLKNTAFYQILCAIPTAPRAANTSW